MSQHLERLNQLAPFLYGPMLRLIQLVKQQRGVDLGVVSGWRSVREQTLTYQKGRTYDATEKTWVITDPKAVVTHAKPGTSAHNVVTMDGRPAAMAADLMPLKGADFDWIARPEFWQPIYILAWKCGLDPLGDDKGAKLAGDWGHFEEPGWKSKIGGLGLVLPTDEVKTI